jgi:hypothetical protein
LRKYLLKFNNPFCFSQKKYSENYRTFFCQCVETKIFVSAIIRGEEGVKSKRCSVTAITLSYVLALLHNASGLWRKVIASKSYRSGHKAAVIAT